MKALLSIVVTKGRISTTSSIAKVSEDKITVLEKIMEMDGLLSRILSPESGTRVTF